MADRRRPAAGVPPDGEPERIRQAYLRYEADPAVRRRWDPANAGTRAIHAERREALRDLLALIRQAQIGGGQRRTPRPARARASARRAAAG